MNSLTTFFAHSLWYLSSLPQWHAFRQAQENVIEVQRTLLFKILHRHAQTFVGQRYGFANIESIKDYQTRVPISCYQDYHHTLKQAENLKYIPYPSALKIELQRAIAPWWVDFFYHHPRLMNGQMYWSWTPSKESITYHLPFFEEDLEEVGSLERYFAQSLFAVPSIVRLIEDIDTFYYVTLLFLLRSHHLTVMSVGHPMFVSLLMTRLLDWWPRLVIDIHQGTITPNTPLPLDLHLRLIALAPAYPRRAVQISKICRTSKTPYSQLWPKLRWIHCWTEAKKQMISLKKFFPKVRIQSKGVMASEGFISFPVFKKTGSILAICSHFFEFLSMESGTLCLAHELQVDQYYEVLFTTAGGLYRYRLHHLVKVVGHVKECPLIHFFDQLPTLSNWFGEKLSEFFVQKTLQDLLTHHQIDPAFIMLACEKEGDYYAYTLFVEAHSVSMVTLHLLANELEQAFQENCHYHYCRQLGYLGPLQLFKIAYDGLANYVRGCLAQGQAVQEPFPLFSQQSGWSKIFHGRFITHLIPLGNHPMR